MTSTGNDIVALNAINIARTKQANFYSKILSVSEKDLYDQQFSEDIPFENFVWLLWSIKESAYKYLQRITPGLVFSPTNTIVRHIEMPEHPTLPEFEGCGFNHMTVYKSEVTVDHQTLYSRSVITGEFICSVVNFSDDFENTCWGIRQIDSSDPSRQSDGVREFLNTRLKAIFPNVNLQISKSLHGYPVLLKDGIETTIPVSLAHHDHYVAYSFIK